MKIALKILPHGQGLTCPPMPRLAALARFAGAVGTPLVIQPGERALVPTGIAMALPANHEGQVRPRSGLAVKFGLTVLNAPARLMQTTVVKSWCPSSIWARRNLSLSTA